MMIEKKDSSNLDIGIPEDPFVQHTIRSGSFFSIPLTETPIKIFPVRCARNSRITKSRISRIIKVSYFNPKEMCDGN
jgi:hypothetical protein